GIRQQLEGTRQHLEGIRRSWKGIRRSWKGTRRSWKGTRQQLEGTRQSWKGAGQAVKGFGHPGASGGCVNVCRPAGRRRVPRSEPGRGVAERWHCGAGGLAVEAQILCLEAADLFGEEERLIVRWQLLAQNDHVRLLLA
ncbi:MAG: hypothetical protein KDD91_16610, partial [Caldilinea sp.]|nr:hypothetical protein [Caldilinea sp.]